MEVIKEIDWTKPVQMRNGTKLHVVTTDGANLRYPVICLKINENGVLTDDVRTFTLNGFYYGIREIDEENNYPQDAINVPEEEPITSDCNEKVLEEVSDIKSMAVRQIYEFRSEMNNKDKLRLHSEDIMAVRTVDFNDAMDTLIKSIQNY